MTKCPVCLQGFPVGDFPALATHLLDQASQSEPSHVRWLNQSISLRRVERDTLTEQLRDIFLLPPEGLAHWIKRRFIRRFFGERPHPFVVALQHPERSVLLGYAVEHQHFLRQWVRCCAFILARSGQPDVVLYEIDNIDTEFGGRGPGLPSHYELLLRMGESVGLSRAIILATPGLPTTERVLKEWHRICEQEHWVSAMAAMHSLELIAHRNLLPAGATVHYFDPAILDGMAISPETKAFLREGYEVDLGHADAALALVERHAQALNLVEDVQSVFLRSIDLFDDYLGARLERAEMYGPPA
ncbi:MAG: iron-containing redox enzyme family protein [Thermoplasmata archaeon]|nr:iron-containing redox enzyme family protein [Thermoplasmata archaeon]